jgi:hypothetical protein
MSELDRLKLEIGFHEKMFFSALAVLLGLLGWLAVHFETEGILVLVLATGSSLIMNWRSCTFLLEDQGLNPEGG